MAVPKIFKSGLNFFKPGSRLKHKEQEMDSVGINFEESFNIDDPDILNKLPTFRSSTLIALIDCICQENDIKIIQAKNDYDTKNTILAEANNILIDRLSALYRNECWFPKLFKGFRRSPLGKQVFRKEFLTYHDLLNSLKACGKPNGAGSRALNRW